MSAEASDSLIFESAEPIKAIGEIVDNKARVGAYAIRFSGPDSKDSQGEYFTAETDFGHNCGNGAGVLFHHGMTAGKAGLLGEMGNGEYGPAKAVRDDVGVFAEVMLDLSDKHQAAFYAASKKGALRWSSGSATHMVRKADDGRITRWPIVEFSFTPTPVDAALPAIRPLKAAELSDADAAALSAAMETPVDTTGEASAAKAAPAPISSKPRIIMSDKTPEQLDAEHKAAVDIAVKARGTEIGEIYAIGDQFNCRDAAKTFVNDGKTSADFKDYVLKDVLKARPVNLDAGLVMNGDEKAIGEFSILKACRESVSRKGLTGLEKEACEAAVKALGRSVDLGERENAGGFIIPEDVLRFGAMKSQLRAYKAQNMGTATAGGFTMQPQLGPMIELLRNKMVVAKAGATMLGGLTGDVYLPQHISGSTAYWVSEDGTITDSQSVFAQKKLTPKRVGSSVPYTTQFLQQSSIDAESFIRNDATKAIAIAKDLACLHGTGVNGQPLGVATTAGINATVTYGGAPTWADVVQHETGIADDNADFDVMAFILSVATVGKWKTTLKDSVAGASYLLNGAGESMEAGGFRAFRTKQVAGDVSFFGAWSQLICASWAGLEIIVDPYALKKAGQVEITFNELVDNLVRQPLAFNVSTDSAAQ